MIKIYESELLNSVRPKSESQSPQLNQEQQVQLNKDIDMNKAIDAIKKANNQDNQDNAVQFQHSNLQEGTQR